VKANVRTATRGTTNQLLSELLGRLNPVLRGWTNCDRHGVASKTFSYLTAFVWRRAWSGCGTNIPKPR
jgi:RNA-directed DNA polymerase